MKTDQILYNVQDHIATITLNRPHKLNAWTLSMEREVHAAMREAEQDESVNVIVLTGAGRGFCAGADVSLLQSVRKNGLGILNDEQPVNTPVNRHTNAVRKDFQKRYSYLLA